MQMRIHVTNGNEALLAAASEITALLEGKGLEVASIQVLAPVTDIAPALSPASPPAAMPNPQTPPPAPKSEETPASQPSAENKVATSEEPTIAQKLEAKFGTNEPLYVPFNAGSSKKIDGKFLSEYTIRELVQKGEVPIVSTVRDKLLRLSTGEKDEANPYDARLYWTEKALIEVGAIQEFSVSLLL